MVFESFSEADTFALGIKIGSEAKPGQVYTLIGDLGVGKTAFTKLVCKYDTLPNILLHKRRILCIVNKKRTRNKPYGIFRILIQQTNFFFTPVRTRTSS